MSFVYDLNGAVPATGAATIRRLKTALVAAGWTVKGSGSTGTGYSGTGDIITTDAIMAVTDAWFRIQDPAGHREFIFQRGTTNLLWRVKYSANPTGVTGFTGGSPSATQTPSASDEQTVYGGGTDASPTFTALLSADGGYKIWIACGDSTVGYGWYIFAGLTGTGSPEAFFYLDVMRVGTYPSGDVDPAVVYFSTPGTAVTTINQLGTYATGPQGWFAYGLGGSAFQRIIPAAMIDWGTFYGAIPSNVQASPVSGNDVCTDVLYMRGNNQSIPGGIKGCGTLFRMQGTPRAIGTPYHWAVNYDFAALNAFIVPTNALIVL